MTIEEIKNKINAAIRGQGTNIDAGGALADILEGIIAQMQSLRPVLEINLPVGGFYNKTEKEAAELLGISETQFKDLHRGAYPAVVNDLTSFIVTTEIIEGFSMVRFYSDNSGALGEKYELQQEGPNLWSLYED